MIKHMLNSQSTISVDEFGQMLNSTGPKNDQ